MSDPVASPSPARLFIGLWPPDGVRDAIGQHAHTWSWPRGASRVRYEKLHMTLHFLGAVERARIGELVQALALPFEPFELRLTRGELWPGGIAVLCSAGTPRALQDLHERLKATLEGLGQSTARAHLRPHVTLARRAQGAVPPPQHEDIAWAVDGFSLIESDLRPPGHYHRLFTHPRG